LQWDRPAQGKHLGVRLADGRGRTKKANPPVRHHDKRLAEVSQWLQQLGVTHVAMESTGVYWKPVWNLLEGQFELLLVNAQHIKQVPGRKTDTRDCEGIADLLQHGLLREVTYLLQHNCLFRELGADYYQRLRAPSLSQSLVRRLQRLGYQVTLAPAPQLM
jgi:transposase